MTTYLSARYKKEPIIDERNAHIWAPKADVIIKGERFRRGLELPSSSERASQRAAVNGLSAYTGKIYPRSEWKDRIEERERNGRILSKLIRQKGIPTSNQNSTNFCWCYGVVSAINCARVWRNLPYIEYSRESVCGPIKSYRNQGGWGVQALEYIVKNGLMPQELWPRYYYRNSQYNTPENLAIAAQHKVTEFLILPDDDFAAGISALIDDHPIAVGYNWWGHEVCAVDPVIIGTNSYGFRIWNSWSDSYGDKGMAILAESKATANDQVIPVVQIAA